jgi:hypothetical protein
MPRYHFNWVTVGGELDPDGIYLPGDTEAREEAVRYVGTVLSEKPQAFLPDQQWQLDVTNGSRNIVFSLIVVGVSPVEFQVSPNAHRVS